MHNLIRALRSVLDKAQDAPTLSEVLVSVEQFVGECTESKEPEVKLYQFEEELGALHHEVIDYSSTYHTEVFLAVLHHLAPILPATSVIAWFDVVLRPALREPKLPTAALNHAKELIISTLGKTQDAYASRVDDFRRRLMELYLLDAYNEGSGLDALEWVELKEEEQVRRTRWKHNLQDILIAYGHHRPEDFLTEINAQFAQATHRLQLLILLNKFTSSTDFPPCTSVFASHAITRSLWKCLLFDYSSTVCIAALTLVVQLLPYFAVHTKQVLKTSLPTLFAILARVMCWKDRNPLANGENDEAFERELYTEDITVLRPAPEQDWQLLEMAFQGTPVTPPSPRPFFSILFYLYPSNVLRFFRWPYMYFDETSYASPYTVPWPEVFDENAVRRASENLMREHICHPFLIWASAADELDNPNEFWSKYDVPRIGSEATMLDIRYLSIGLREKFGLEKRAEDNTTKEEDAGPFHFIRPIDLSSGKVVISLQDMIDASVALKSNIDVEVQKPHARWSSVIFPDPAEELIAQLKERESSVTPTATSPVPVGEADEEKRARVEKGKGEDKTMKHVAAVISGLQKEVLLLRNELNFELWHSRENAKHVGRLYGDRILMKSAESERQGLYNKLRKYRSQVAALDAELAEHRAQSASAKSRYADWTKELQEKLKAMREEKKKLTAEVTSLRSSEEDLRALFEAQGKRLSEALSQVFVLHAEQKRNIEQIERLKDYERQIEELTKLRQTWEDDSRKFADVDGEMRRLQERNAVLEKRVEALEAEREQSRTEEAQEYKRQIQSLELRLAQMEELADPGSRRLSDENSALKTEVEELQATVQTLKAQNIMT
ncbi:hypothetical protein BKA70DRAFT_1367098 [Coprinopsis sp. MPI-PUGE-AT-0042]|nr:hypothetical protein BKA70DRAFT_1367098 [Coprinopsis sp. MPI-PUGE-AT-0042]